MPACQSEKDLLELLDLQQVPGFINNKRALILYRAAKGLRKDAVVVELGSYKGKSTICLAKGLQDAGNLGACVYAVDPFKGVLTPHLCVGPTYEAFKQNLVKCGVEKFVEPLQMTSKAAALQWGKKSGQKIDLLFVDHEKEYPEICLALGSWTRQVSDGGLVLVDDIPVPDVKKCFFKKIVCSPEFGRISCRGMAKATKSHYGAGQQLANGLYFFGWLLGVFLTQLPYRLGLKRWVSAEPYNI